MSTINNSDLFLVERAGTSYKVEASNLNSAQDTDLFLVNRAGTSYSVQKSLVSSKVLDSDLLLCNRAGSSYKVDGDTFKGRFGTSSAASIAPYPDVITGNPAQTFNYVENQNAYTEVPQRAWDGNLNSPNYTPFIGSFGITGGVEIIVNVEDIFASGTCVIYYRMEQSSSSFTLRSGLGARFANGSTQSITGSTTPGLVNPGVTGSGAVPNGTVAIVAYNEFAGGGYGMPCIMGVSRNGTALVSSLYLTWNLANNTNLSSFTPGTIVTSSTSHGTGVVYSTVASPPAVNLTNVKGNWNNGDALVIPFW